MIRITAKQDGFRRCGIAHPATLTEHADDAFTPEQIDIMSADPALVVDLADYAAPEKGKKAK